MAKKLPWGNFSTDELRVDHEDDIYINFPYLELEELEMTPINHLSSPNENTTRGTAGIIPTKKQAIFQREFLGAYRLLNFCKLVGRAKKHRVT